MSRYTPTIVLILVLIGAGLSLFFHFADPEWEIFAEEPRDDRIRRLIDQEVRNLPRYRGKKSFRYKERHRLESIDVQFLTVQTGFDTPIIHCIVATNGGWCGKPQGFLGVVEHYELGAKPKQLADADWVYLAGAAVQGQVVDSAAERALLIARGVSDTGFSALPLWSSILIDYVNQESGLAIVGWAPLVTRYPNNGVSVSFLAGSKYRVWGRGPTIAFIHHYQVDVWPNNEVQIQEWPIWASKK